jgi:hypothetical protein
MLQMGARLMASASRQYHELQVYAGTAPAAASPSLVDRAHSLATRSSMHHRRLGYLYADAHTQLAAVVAGEHDLATKWSAWYPDFEVADDNTQARRIQATKSLLGLDAAQFLPITQRIAELARKQSSSGAALTELLGHSSGMLEQLSALLARREALSLSLRESDAESSACGAKLGQLSRRAAQGEPVDEELLAASNAAARVAAICRDKSRQLTEFHATAARQIEAYTARRRAELKRVLAAFVHAQIQNQAHITSHFTHLLHQVEDGDQSQSQSQAAAGEHAYR